MYRIDQLEKEWLRNLWSPAPQIKTEDDFAFDYSPFLFKEDEERFNKIIAAHGWEGADIVATLFPLKLAYPHLVFDQDYTEKHHNAYFEKRFGIDSPLAEDFNPEEPRDEHGRWTDGEASFSEKTDAFKAHLEKLPHENGETSFSQLEDYLQHFLEDNFQTDTTNALDLKQALAENILESTAESFRGNKNPLKIAASLPINLVANAAPAFIKHFLKKGWHFTNKSSLHFPLRKGLAPWMEREGEIIGKRQKYGVVRLMPASDDPYQSALNFVRAIRKYKSKQGITSQEIATNSRGKENMLLIQFSDKTTISIRKAGDSGRLTPDDQVTVGIKGHPELASLSNASKSKMGKEFKFKFPDIPITKGTLQ